MAIILFVFLYFVVSAQYGCEHLFIPYFCRLVLSVCETYRYL